MGYVKVRCNAKFTDEFLKQPKAALLIMLEYLKRLYRQF